MYRKQFGYKFSIGLKTNEMTIFSARSSLMATIIAFIAHVLNILSEPAVTVKKDCPEKTGTILLKKSI